MNNDFNPSLCPKCWVISNIKDSKLYPQDNRLFCHIDINHHYPNPYQVMVAYCDFMGIDIDGREIILSKYK